MGAAPGHVPFAPPVAFLRVPHMALLSRILPRIEQLEGRSCKEGLPVSQKSGALRAPTGQCQLVSNSREKRPRARLDGEL